MANKTQLRRDLGKGLLFGLLSAAIVISQQHQNAVEVNEIGISKELRDDTKETKASHDVNIKHRGVFSEQLSNLDWLSGNPLPPLAAEANLSQEDKGLFETMQKQHDIALALTGNVRSSAAELFDQGKYSECVQFIDGLPNQNKVDLSDLRARAYLQTLLVGYDDVVPESVEEKSELIDRLKEALGLLSKPNRNPGEEDLFRRVRQKIDQLQESLE